jgi:hypothetical protein
MWVEVHMSIWDFWTTKAQDYVHGMLDEDQCPSDVQCYTLEPDQHYIQVVLRRMWIANVRRGINRFYGAVHADVGSLQASGKLTSFTQVVAPPELRDVSAANFNRSIVSNQPLFGPMPYRGGSLKVNAALLSVRSADLLGPYLDVLTELGALAGVAYISVARPFLDPLRRGIDLLTGVTGPQSLEIYLVTNLVKPMTGVYVVMRAPNTQIRLHDLRVNDDYSLSHTSGADLSRYPYMVLTVDGATKRADWRGIPEVGLAYDGLVEALKTDNPPDVEEAIAFFRRTALLNDDLIPQHARALVEQVRDMKNEVLGATLTAGTTAILVPPLDIFNPFAGPNWKPPGGHWITLSTG